MKKIYEKPVMLAEAFVANTYCEDCSTPGHSGYTIKFLCDAGIKNQHYGIKDASGNYLTARVVDPRTGRSGNYTVSGRLRQHIFGNDETYFETCDATHTFTVATMEELYTRTDIKTGYHLDIYDTSIDENIPVTIWTDNNTNVHCTTILNPEKWEIAKS